MYKLCEPSFFSNQISNVLRLIDNSFIPFAKDNADYQRFKKDIMAGGELQDADGVVMTDAQEFVASLP